MLKKDAIQKTRIAVEVSRRMLIRRFVTWYMIVRAWERHVSVDPYA